MAAAPFVLAGPASAQQFKVTATGTVTSVEDSVHLYNSSVAIGTPFTFSFVFDYSAPDGYPNDPNHGVYKLSGNGNGATVSVGDYKFTPSAASLSDVGVTHNNDQDAISFYSQNEIKTGLSSPGTNLVRIYLTGPSGKFLTSDALPPLSAYNQINLAAPNYSQFIVQVQNSTSYYSNIVGEYSFNSLKAELVNPAAAVPEASTTVSLGVLLALGGLTLAVRRRRVAAGE